MNTTLNSKPATESTRSELRYAVPSVDITESKNEYLLEADMPGVTKASLEVLLEGNELTIIGRRAERSATGAIHVESNAADYRRAFVLDPVIDASRLTAHIDHGVLRIRLPKAEAIQPRRICVTD